jgi:hypothetical protein
MHQYLAFFLHLDRLSNTTWPYCVLRTLHPWNPRSKQLLFVFSDFKVPFSMFIWVTSYACFKKTVSWQELVVVVML